MSTSLANPRRTRIVAWPTQGSANPDQEQPAPSADTATAADDQGGEQ
ncbi:hypothetical protein GCM10023085_14010 [Actinomadura viridis]|uniref:Uncharacterized protein n=1 Tax=Actinomadura viridis TaxID=58110 RepID=A0A931DS61_9ACTN|nr:hypothetical protein [Actinomadura viridis]MBG6093774.1 hypothetical protein [Actinomadura viridis]